LYCCHVVESEELVLLGYNNKEILKVYKLFQYFLGTYMVQNH